MNEEIQNLGSERKEKEPQRIVIQTTRALGDVIMLEPVLRILVESGRRVVLPMPAKIGDLVRHLQATEPNSPGVEIVDPQLPYPGAINTSNYLACFPQINYLPGTNRFGHLSEWQAFVFMQESGIQFEFRPDMLRLPLTEDEVRQGKEIIKKISQEHDGKPVIVIVPAAASYNKSLSPQITQELVDWLTEFCQPVLSVVDPSYNEVQGTRLQTPQIRLLPAATLAAGGLITVDSAPLHLTYAAMRWAQMTSEVESLCSKHQLDPQKIIGLLGSSSPQNVLYEGNQSVCSSPCELGRPCAAHGYTAVDQYSEQFDRKFYPQSNDTAKLRQAACIYPDYTENPEHSSVCMKGIKTEEVVQKVHSFLQRSSLI
ncbi:MAG: hypothetical protein M1514_01560 [Patescibacteria group bacterium]|nr:hypothetical protein [Patescibacteria group bacterium]